MTTKIMMNTKLVAHSTHMTKQLTTFEKRSGCTTTENQKLTKDKDDKKSNSNCSQKDNSKH